MLNGMIYFIMSWFGILALIQSVVNQACIGPIVLFVGEYCLNSVQCRTLLLTTVASFSFCRSRH